MSPRSLWAPSPSLTDIYIRSFPRSWNKWTLWRAAILRTSLSILMTHKKKKKRTLYVFSFSTFIFWSTYRVLKCLRGAHYTQHTIPMSWSSYYSVLGVSGPRWGETRTILDSRIALWSKNPRLDPRCKGTIETAKDNGVNETEREAERKSKRPRSHLHWFAVQTILSQVTSFCTRDRFREGLHYHGLVRMDFFLSMDFFLKGFYSYTVCM